MAKGRLAVFFCALAMATSVGTPSPRAATETDCMSSPYDAVMRLPSPLRKWGQINCTPFGHVLASREGWIWAWLDGARTAFVPSQVQKNPDRVGNESYFTTIKERELKPEEFAFAFSVFNDGLSFTDGLNLDEETSHGYRVDLTSVSGKATTLYFFDFGNFAGGMWCPGDGCIPDSRFMIMEDEHKPHPPSI